MPEKVEFSQVTRKITKKITFVPTNPANTALRTVAAQGANVMQRGLRKRRGR